MAASGSKKATGNLEYAFKRYASKAGCQEATRHDLVRWCNDAGVFDVAFNKCTSTKLNDIFNGVKQKKKHTVTLSDMPAILEKLSYWYGVDMEIDDDEEAYMAMKGDLMGVVKGPNDTVGGCSDLERQFRRFAMKGEGTEATLKDVIHWFTDAGVFINNKKCNTNSVDIAFTAIKQKGKPTIQIDDMDTLLARISPEYAEDQNMDLDVATARLYQMLADTEKLQHGATKTTTVGGVEKLTDTTKYTGMHKDRFDEDGRGRGIDGRIPKNTGYVGSYKGAGTYDDTH